MDPTEPKTQTRTLRGLLRSWYSLNAAEQKALLLLLALLFLGIVVRCVLRGFAWG